MVGEPTFYEKSDESVIELIKKNADADLEFVLKLAAYTRNELYLRTGPQVMLVECALSDHANKSLVRKYAPQIIKRPDEMATCVAYLQSRITHIRDMMPILERLCDPEAVRKSKQFPFRFLNAYNAVGETSNLVTNEILDNIEKALELSVSNIPTLTGTTFITSDNSASMNQPVT